MSGASRRGYQRGRNRPFGERGGASFGRGAREQSRGRTDPSRVGRSGNYTKSETQLDYESLSTMLEKDPDELVLDMTSDRYLPAIKGLLSQSNMSDKEVVVILKVFARACDSETSRVFLVILLNELFGSVYLSTSLTTYINCLAHSVKDDTKELECELKCMLKLFTESLRKLPTSFPNLPLANLYVATKALVESGQLCNPEIKSSVENLMALKDEMAEKVKKELNEQANKPKRRQRKEEAALLDNEEPPDNFQWLSVIPGASDIHADGPVFFRRNKVEGSYDGPEHYLDVQFRLLREDFIRPLREGISALSDKTGTVSRKPSQDIRVYYGVNILDPLCTSKGVTHNIRFDVSGLHNVRWENSKRLIYGSLLCLSKDHFETFIFATVEDRNPYQLVKGKLVVRFTNINSDFGKETYQMVETSAYFEAYRHVLEGLQEISPNDFPFERYIVKSEPDVQAPLYLRNGEVKYDLTCIMKSQFKKLKGNGLPPRKSPTSNKKAKSVRILDMDSWPSAEDLELDSSQLKAVQLALTKEFAIIQGPPGTGKTYIGLKVARVLLNNKSHWNDVTTSLDGINRRKMHADLDDLKYQRRSILVVCYTNHALDQFLEGIHDFHPGGIIRVGGRSQSSKLEDCSIRLIKKKIRAYHKGMRRRNRHYFDDIISDGEEEDFEPIPELSQEQKEIYEDTAWIRSKFSTIYMNLKEISRKVDAINSHIDQLTRKVIDEKVLNGHMSADHYNSMVTRFRGIAGTHTKVKPDVMHYWLELLVNTFDCIEPGSIVEPVAVYPLTTANKSNAFDPSESLDFKNTFPNQGIDGKSGGSYHLSNNNSHILIPNVENSLLDTHFSMTILLYVYPMSSVGGPIITFHQQQFIGIQISQKEKENGKGVLSVSFNSRYGVICKPIVTDGVLEMNEWNYIGASYDYDSGISRVYHNGNMVREQQNEANMEIASHLPVHIGSLNFTDDGSSFCGRVSSLQFYSEAISQEQILAIAGIPAEDIKETVEVVFQTSNNEATNDSNEQKGDIVYQADAIENLRKLDVDADDLLDFDEEDLEGESQKPSINHFDGNYAASQEEWQIHFPNQYDRHRNGTPEEWQMQCPKFTGSRVMKALRREMAKTDIMEDDEVERITDVWALSKKDKWRLYRYWIEELRESYRRKIRRCYPKFEDIAERFKALQRQEDLIILKKATIIGMTTTGAAKYRELIQTIRPRITIVEEAAEVLESHIVTSLSSGCQHLILIGDHQQLRPSPNVYELAKDYKLDVSLFERMVDNNMQYQRLHAQHRMRPEISRMLKPIYDDLKNHESVLNFENIKGVNGNIFFVDHNELEDFVKEGRSRSNIHEAQYLAALCKYFILQGYDQEKITILTMYVGQLLQLKKVTSDKIFHGVRICAVDNFQGEENDIILLSLVRSNEEGNIGFLRISNRVCVALSRAKKGFYCIGNLELMCRKEKLWAKIIEDMRDEGNVGQSLTLMCQNHPNTIIHASKAKDFQGAPQGGCMLPCRARLECGHVCRLLCHPKDPEHIEYNCQESCTKTCVQGHNCRKRCYEDCGHCTVRMEKIMPQCKHTQNLPCYLEPINANCRVSCSAVLKCGHKCAGNCHDCFQERLHIQCQQKCERTLLCGHKCLELCARKCPPCRQECENECFHQKCKETCGVPWQPCKKRCSWNCMHHKCTRRCGEPCNRQRCNKPCKKTLKCRHPCIGMCGEPCPKKCRVCDKDEVTEILFGDEDKEDARFVELQPCGHVIEVNAMDALMNKFCSGSTQSIQLKGCPRCEIPIRTCPRYGKIIKNTLMGIEKVKTELSVPDCDIQKEASRLKNLISFSKEFRNDSEFIERKLERKDLTVEQLKMYQNQITFLNLLSEIFKKIADIELHPNNTNAQNRLKKALKKEIRTLETRVSILIRGSCEFSDQEKEDLGNELLRMQLIVSYKILEMMLKEREVVLEGTDKYDMEDIGQTIDTGKRIDEKKRDLHMKAIERISSTCDILYERPITKEDTMKMITNNTGFTQGNWFKCPKGHVHSIYGGIGKHKCPKCQ